MGTPPCEFPGQWFEFLAKGGGVDILVLGGTRFFGIHLVRELLAQGHRVTLATRGLAADEFADRVGRLIVERTDPDSLWQAFEGKRFDVVCDNLAYASNDVRNLLNCVDCHRYLMVSSASVYADKHLGTREEEFDPLTFALAWCSRGDFPYDETKRQAECALFQSYPLQRSAAVRFPFVIGEDDYTQRLYFYVEHVVKGQPMHINNLESQLGFLRSDEAGKFLAHLASSGFCGSLNGCSHGTISVAEMLAYLETKTGHRAVLAPDGDTAPYNWLEDFSLDTGLAERGGFVFSSLKDWIYRLLDHYVAITRAS